MTTVLRFDALAGLFCGAVFDVTIPSSSFSDGAKYNQTLRPFAHPCAAEVMVHSITVQSRTRDWG